jgi:DNA-3-methyladenine glycosylase II
MSLALELSANPAIVSTRLHPTPPYDFKQALQFLQNSGAHDLNDSFGTEPDSAQIWLERPVSLQGKAFLIRLSNLSDDINAPAIQLRVQAEDSSEATPSLAEVELLVTKINRRFWLDLDMQLVRETLMVNEYGEQLLSRFWPSRPTNLAGPWEGLLKTVISVQIYPGLAQRLQRSLLELYGQRVYFDGKEYHLFPTAEKLVTLTPDELLTMKFSKQKARYLPGIAEMVLANPTKYDWERLHNAPGVEAVAALDDLPGVGEWTASYCAMRALPHLDVMTKEEGLRKTLANAYDRRAVVSVTETEKLMEIFAPYRSIACYYTYMLMYNA